VATHYKKQRSKKSVWLWISACIVLGIACAYIFIQNADAPSGKNGEISTFEACVAAGNRVQESYPEVCVTEDNKQFINPKQRVEP